MTTAQDGGKVVSLTHRPLFTPRKYSWYSFLLELVLSCSPQTPKLLQTNFYSTFLSCGERIQLGPGPFHYWRFEITHRHTTLRQTPLEERSTCCRDFYLTTYVIRKIQTSVPSARFESAVPANELPQAYALDRATTRIVVYCVSAIDN